MTFDKLTWLFIIILAIFIPFYSSSFSLTNLTFTSAAGLYGTPRATRLQSQWESTYWYTQGRFIESSTCWKLELTLRLFNLFFIPSPEPYDFKFTNLIGVININWHSLVSRIVDVKLSKCIFSLVFGNYWEEVSTVHSISLTFLFSFTFSPRNLPFVSI